MDSLGRYIAVIIAVILFFLVPLKYIALDQDEHIDSIVNNHSEEFTDTARQQGYISLDMYENLVQELAITNELYDIDLEVIHPVSGKEVTCNTLGDKIQEFKTEKVSFNRNNVVSTNTINELNNNEIKSFDAHTHTEDCYAGHRHNGCVPSGEMNIKVYAIHKNGSNRTNQYNNTTVYCSKCNNELFTVGNSGTANIYPASSQMNTGYKSYDSNGNILSEYYTDSYHINIDPSDMIYIIRYAGNAFSNYVLNHPYDVTDAGGDEYSSYTNYKVKDFIWDVNQKIPSRSWEKVNGVYSHVIRDLPFIGCVYCGEYGKSYSCGQIQDNTPICNQVVTSITATNPIQSVVQGSDIITTATATYLDGQTGPVNCTSNFNTNLIGTQMVTLSYSGKVINAKTSGSLTCVIQATVRSAATLTSITVSPSTQNIPRYTDPIFNVTAYYNNGTNKAVTGYSISGFHNSQIGNQTVTITYVENSITRMATIIVTVNNLTKICPICGMIYHLDDNDKDNGCPNCISTITGITATPDNCVISKGEPLPVLVEAIYRNGNKATVTDWTSNFYPNMTGIQEVTIMYQGHTTYVLVEVKGNKTCDVCGKEYVLNQDGTDPGCPYCKTEIISIEVSPKNVTIEKHMPLPITVIATYRDGHTEAVIGWHTDLNADITGTFDVNVYYQNVEDNLTVTIRDDRLIICPICGLEYIFSEYPDSCPVCSKTVIGIEAGLRNGGTKVQYKANLDLEITLIYKDNHKELTNTGWTTEGYRPDVLGLQTIMVYYKEFTTTLEIEVVNTLSGVYCPNGHYYYLNEDGSDPGCPYCNETSSDHAVFYFISVYTEEIIDKLYADGVYNLQAGDYLVVTIRPKNKSISSKLVYLFSSKELKEEYTYGGEIL